MSPGSVHSPDNGSTTQVVSQGQVVYVPAMQTFPVPEYRYEQYQHKQSTGLGGVQLVIGILCIAFNAVGLGVGRRIWSGLMNGHGFWGGILFFVTGCIGISAGKEKTRCKIVSFMVLCILSACCCGIVLPFAIVGAVVAFPDEYPCSSHYHNDDYPYYSGPRCKDEIGYKVVIAMEALLAIAALVEGIIAIWGSAICCKAVCRGSFESTHGVVLPPTYYAGNGQVVYVNQPQPPSYNPGYPVGQVVPPAYPAAVAQTPWNQSPTSYPYYPPPHPHQQQPFTTTPNGASAPVYEEQPAPPFPSSPVSENVSAPNQH